MSSVAAVSPHPIFMSTSTYSSGTHLSTSVLQDLAFFLPRGLNQQHFLPRVVSYAVIIGNLSRTGFSSHPITRVLRPTPLQHGFHHMAFTARHQFEALTQRRVSCTFVNEVIDAFLDVMHLLRDGHHQLHPGECLDRPLASIAKGAISSMPSFLSNTFQDVKRHDAILPRVPTECTAGDRFQHTIVHRS